MIFITLAKLKDKNPWRLRGCSETCRSTYDIYNIVNIYMLLIDWSGKYTVKNSRYIYPNTKILPLMERLLLLHLLCWTEIYAVNSSS